MPSPRWTASTFWLALALVACGAGESPTAEAPTVPEGAEIPTHPAAPTVLPPCPAGASDALVLSYALYGTHGMDFQETLTISCNGDVVLDAPHPWTLELRDRPGRYTHHLDAARIEQLRDLAVRLAAPVGAPSFPPMGADVTVTAYTTPEVSRPLRPGEDPHDGEAAAVMSSVIAEIVLALPPLVTCDAGVSLEGTAGLRAGVDGMVVVRLRNAADHSIHVAMRHVTEAIQIVNLGGTIPITADTEVAFMLEDMTVIGFVSPMAGLGPRTIEIPARSEAFAAVHVTFPSPGPVRVTARIAAHVFCEAPTAENLDLPAHTYESPEITLDIAP